MHAHKVTRNFKNVKESSEKEQNLQFSLTVLFDLTICLKFAGPSRPLN